MLRSLVTLLCLAVLHPAHCYPSQVISGVFLSEAENLTYFTAETACATYNASLASLAQVTNAYSHGYEFCKWGWIKEHNIVMLRLTPGEKCGNYSVGILVRECQSQNAESVFCYKNNGNSSWLYTEGNATMVYESASALCAMKGGRIATQEQIETTTNRSVTINSPAWFDRGIGEILPNGTFIVTPCQDTKGNVSAFCYNPQMPDLLLPTDNKVVKIIVIACVLGSIFLVLLIAAAFMKGNQFICCIKDKSTLGPSGSIHSHVPTWNVTSTYRPRVLSLDPIYINTAGTNIVKRPPVIHPDMSKYRTHTYSNMGYDNVGDQ
ncbi:aggrecan core protein-like [Discoglossus pictus]